jgi:hypothetical protein
MTGNDCSILLLAGFVSLDDRAVQFLVMPF